MSLTYRIADALFDAHPHYCRGVAVFDQADNRLRAGWLHDDLEAVHRQLRETVQGNVAEHPRVASWREAYRRFGAKPAEHRSSIEAMLRRVLKPDRIPSINPLVDLGNLVSLQQVLPAGVHPWPDGLQSVELRLAAPGDVFRPADGGPDEAPPAGEVVFVAGTEVLTRRWTWRQAAGTQTLPDTRRVFFNIDGLPPTPREAVDAALQQVLQQVQAHGLARLLGSGVLHAGCRSLSFG
ncbi:MAG: hypothetical protein RJA10_2481 [Pseudomonadota bacterium]|jgi:DNA/RNA-binding domain of Phe-tRNA-synthetase-like protein